MNKTLWIICIVVFVFVSAFVLSLDNSMTSRRVKFTNQNFEIKHENTELVNDENTKINLANSNIENKKLATANKDLDLNSSGVKLNNSGNIEGQNSTVHDEGYYARQQTNFGSNSEVKNQQINYKNLDDSNLDNIINNADNNIENRTNLKTEPLKVSEQEKYAYKNLDWNAWRSNFVNKILDDSIYIHELDKYGEGAWFVYSFDVHKNGAISNISVKSMYLTPYDKQLVANLIKSYEYKSITIFPKDSKRQVAKVTAVMMLSNTSSYSKPSDFNDGERVKIKL